MTATSQDKPSSTLVKLATTAIGVALLINDRRKQKSQQLIESTQKTSADLIERGAIVDQQLRSSTNQIIEETQSKLEQQLDSGKSVLKQAQHSVEKAADLSRDRLLSISGVATHKDVKDNAKLAHLNALSSQIAVSSDHMDFQLKKQFNELSQKADKFDLAPLARSVELKALAKQEDLHKLATHEDLTSLATSEELAALATKADLELLAHIPILTEKVDTLTTKDDLVPLAKEQSIKAVQKVLENQMETHHARIEILMAQLATREDVHDVSRGQITRQDIDSATSLLASKEDVESVVKQLIKHIHHLERQVVLLKEKLPDTDRPEMPKNAAISTVPAKPEKASAEKNTTADTIDSVQVRAH
ncbi:hypothetical protein [Litoribrevibacter albus]|uniref:Uncharacterized protein n=1 Tax=Litoribrevibacter albus TaxID=1473156 RepID=A0AA37W6X8_9GAMM|nr:hypothetical protein [Litoribrevibacter albus]GLQ30509.1 hypothetical protein GCM10007876_09870 [Litoribrevibacter albus]